MKRIFAALFAAVLLACNSGGEGAANVPDVDLIVTDTGSTVGTGMNPDDTAGIMGSMNKMMRDMGAMTMTGDPDMDFALLMKRHHAGAIEMSRGLLNEGRDSSLKSIAQKIINESQQEMAILEKVSNTGKETSKSDFSEKAMAMMKSSSSLPMHKTTQNSDTMYADLMIRHHQHGIDISKEYLKSGKNNELKAVAGAIVRSQPGDIQKLRRWTSNQAAYQ